VAVALADKLDSLVGFFAIGEKPTGSGDPFALRRAALGVIRIVREVGASFPLQLCIAAQFERLINQLANKREHEATAVLNSIGVGGTDESDADVAKYSHHSGAVQMIDLLLNNAAVLAELPSFILDRLRVTLRDEGFAPDILEAAFAVQDDDINRIVARVIALSTFLKTDDGKNLSAGYKRASNILKAEDKKGALPDSFTIDDKALERNEEMALNDALAHVQVQLPDLLKAEDFDGAMTLLSKLRVPVDAFFEADFMVNDPEPAKRLNRLALLASLRDATLQVADFEKMAG
jgi:glycyl-tRNA synthetase beta chain